MALLITILGAIFVLGNVYAEWINRKTMAWYQNPLSAYLSGVPGAKIQSASYLVFAVGLVLFGWQYLGGPVDTFLGWVAGLALLGVVATKMKNIAAYVHPFFQGILNHIHVACAGLAFVSVTAILIRLGYLQHLQIVFALGIAAPIVALLFLMFEPEQTSLEEKSYTGLLLLDLFIVLWAI